MPVVIPVTLSTGSVYTYGMARAFELAAQAGYDGVEVIVDDRWDTRQPDYLRRMSREHGLPVLSVHSPFGTASGWPKDEVERVKRSLDVAEAVGARTLNVHLPYRFLDLSVSAAGRTWRAPLFPPSANQRRYLHWLTEGGLEAQQRQSRVTIAVENLPVRRVLGRSLNPYALNTWGELRRFPHLCLDTTHCGTTGADLLAVYEQLADRIAHVHLSNFNGTYQHQPLEKGYLPLDTLLERLAVRDYAGIVVVELTPHALPVQEETKLTAELRRNLLYCRQHLGQASGEAPAEAPDKGQDHTGSEGTNGQVESAANAGSAPAVVGAL